MAGRKNGNKELVQIDADWLLGESMDRPLPRRSWFLRIVLLLGFVVAAVWSWPYVPRQWLPLDWKQQLSRPENNSSEELLPSLLALNDLDPKHSESAIQKLAVAGITLLPQSSKLHPNTPNDLFRLQKPAIESIPGNQALTIPGNQALTIPGNQALTTIRGIEKLPIEKLFPLLSSTLPKIVQEASKELVQRGMSAPQLELAIDLAQGNIEQRTMAMDRLVQDQDVDPIPWLVWMAEQSDIQVRRKAVSLLGLMSNPNAIHTLRMLEMREPDSAIVEQISQVLLAFGSTTNNHR
jgi:hypothetical protein